MAARLRCPRGHFWQPSLHVASGDSTGLLPQCPICGEIGEMSAPDSNGEFIESVGPTSRLDSANADYSSGRSRSFGRVQAPAIPGYEILDEIGRGGMGVVYRAIDLKRGGQVAVKYLPRIDPAMLLRFKQEFRSTADLAHRNIAAVHELRQVDGNWCLVMELVEGRPFTDRFLEIPDLADRVKLLGPSLRQLAEGLRFLHEAGLLHCDVKPTNVIVTNDDRVVLLDFGLVSEVRPIGHDEATAELVGSLGYIAPERFTGKPPTPASDWYAVGVIVYESLVGRRPFQGTRTNLIWQQQYMQPPPPADVLAGIPEGWSDLCNALLNRDPSARAGAETVLSFLDGNSPAPATRGDSLRVRDVPLVGRDQQLAQLQDAFDLARTDGPVVVRVRGESGMGKSTLIERFLDRLALHQHAVVLRGRCHEQESVPFKGLDGFIDSLCHFLSGFDAEALSALLQPGMGCLARMFPVLRRLRLGAAQWKNPDQFDPAEVRSQAAAALRHLLTHLAQRQPLAIWIDDLQWGDADSVRFLEDILRPGIAPPVLVILSHRTEDESASPTLEAVSNSVILNSHCRRDIEATALTHLEAASLALALLVDREDFDESAANRIGRESGGRPLYVHELTRHLSTQSPGSAAAEPGLTLEQVIRARCQQLTGAERRLLAIVAAAAQPIRESSVVRAAELPTEPLTALNRLRAGHWLRSHERDGDHWIECYHDAIREAVLGSLPPGDLAQLHDRLARAYSASYPVENALLAVHSLGAGRPDEAADYYVKAAEDAMEALAFDRAAQLFRLGLDLRQRPPDQASTLWRRLGDALANTGQGSDAARAYLSACAGCDRTRSLQLQRLAAYQLLTSGSFEEGIRTLREVLAAGGFELPRSQRRAAASLAWERIRQRWSGIAIHERPLDRISADDLEKVDLCWAATAGLSLFDVVAGAYFQSLHLRYALSAGESHRIVRALTWEAAHRSTAGVQAQTRVRELLATARTIVDRLGHPHDAAFLAMAEGIAQYNFSQWNEARTLLQNAEHQLRTRCTGVTWERNVTEAFLSWALLQLGEYTDLASLGHRLLSEARARNDRFAVVQLSTIAVPIVHLAADDPIAARNDLRAEMVLWPSTGFHVPHLTSMFSEVRIDLYQRNYQAAFDRLNDAWPRVQLAELHRTQPVRVIFWHLHGVTAAALAQGDRTAAMLRIAENDAQALEREDALWAAPKAKLVRATIAARRSQIDDARALAAKAFAEFERLHMHTHATVADWLSARLAGADTMEIEARLRARGVSNPSRFIAIIAPGFQRE